MKKLIAIVALALLPFAARAQSTTNLAIRVTVETVTAGVTNSVNTNFRYDWGVTGTTTKDQLKILGLLFAYAQAKSNGFTNDFGAFVKQDIGDRAKSYSDVQQQQSNAATLAKLTTLLTTAFDSLSASDVTSLQTIAAKAP